MTKERTGGKIISVLLLGALLSGCSQPAATAVPAPVVAAAPAATPPTTGLVSGLPDFTALRQ